MAGEEYILTKIIRNGDEYILPGSTQRVSKKIFGTGEDGDCTIEYDDSIKGNVFLEAKEYNFNNLTICPNVKLRFCGTGIPVIRVKESFNNYGTICLRNPLLNTDSQYAEPYSKMVLYSCKNNSYSSALSIYNSLQIECLKRTPSKGGCCTIYSASNSKHIPSAGGCGGTFYASPTIEYGPLCEGHQTHSAAGGANTEYAGGGGGSGGDFSCGCIDQVWTESEGCPGCPAVGCNGGDGGESCIRQPGGGGGGFGMCNGGNGGYGHCGGGSGGNAIYGQGGNGGNSCKSPGDGGCSYYGNGGMGGRALCTSGYGGCSVFGNGGASPIPFCTSCSQYVHRKGGSSVFGNGGGSPYCACDRGDGITGAIAWGGIYDIGLYAKNFSNKGSILGNGNKGCVSGGARGAKMHFVYSSFISNGTITCAGNGCPDGCIVYCQI